MPAAARSRSAAASRSATCLVLATPVPVRPIALTATVKTKAWAGPLRSASTKGGRAAPRASSHSFRSDFGCFGACVWRLHAPAPRLDARSAARLPARHRSRSRPTPPPARPPAPRRRGRRRRGLRWGRRPACPLMPSAVADRGELRLGHQVRMPAGQQALRLVRETLGQPFRHQQAEHPVAHELQPLVGPDGRLSAMAARDRRAVRERLAQQVRVGEGVAERRASQLIPVSSRPQRISSGHSHNLPPRRGRVDGEEDELGPADQVLDRQEADALLAGQERAAALCGKRLSRLLSRLSPIANRLPSGTTNSPVLLASPLSPILAIRWVAPPGSVSAYSLLLDRSAALVRGDDVAERAAHGGLAVHVQHAPPHLDVVAGQAHDALDVVGVVGVHVLEHGRRRRAWAGCRRCGRGTAAARTAANGRSSRRRTWTRTGSRRPAGSGSSTRTGC